MHPPEDPFSHRVLPLEALRGMAAIVMVAYHFAQGFLPQYMNMPPVDPEHTLVGSPLFALINGKAMLAVFFALSAYVLARKGLQPDPVRAIAQTALKRWFRFTPLIFLALLLSWSLYHLGLYYYDDASVPAHSMLLRHFIAHGMPQTWQPPLALVFKEGSWKTLFLLNSNKLDTLLWTMPIEFYGSFLILALALLLAPDYRWALWAAVPAAGFLLVRETVWFIPLWVGFLAAVLRLDRCRLTLLHASCLLVLGMYLCGYDRPVGAYGWLASVAMEPARLHALVSSAAAGCMLWVFGSVNPVADRFSGTISRQLGRMAFGLYLLHLLVLCSASSWAYARLGGGTTGALGAALVFPLAAAPFVVMFAWLDSGWLRLLKQWRPLGIPQ